jgi:hypothetical protein
MSLVLKIAAAGALHAAFMVAYPETGPSGPLYIGISLMLWTGFLAFINTGARLVRLFSGAAGLLVNLAVFAVMGLALAATLPQADRVTVLEKLQAGRYPDRAAVDTGLRRFGINAGREARGLEKDLGRAAQKVKEGLK